MRIWHRTVRSNSKTWSGNESDDHNNQTEKITEPSQDQTSVFSPGSVDPTETAQQNLLQIPESFHSETCTEMVQKSAVELQKHFSEFFSTRANSIGKRTFRIDNMKEESKLQINYGKNKNWDVVNWYNNQINLTLKLKMEVPPFKIFRW